MSGIFDVIDDSPIRYGFIVICRDSAACDFEKISFVGFWLFRVVVINMVVEFHFASGLVDINVY